MTDYRRTTRVGAGSAARKGDPFGVGAPRVPVIEGSETIREMVSEALADAGYLADARSDGDGLEDVLDGVRPRPGGA